MLDESEMERFVREGMEAWDLYDKRTKDKNNMYEEGFPVPDEHLNWKMRLQYGGATVTPELMEKVRAVDFLKDPPEVDLPPKSDKGRKEAEKIMQEEHDRRWKKVAEDVDDLLECFRGFDRAKEKILKRREGILPVPGRRRLAVGVLSDEAGARAGGAGAGDRRGRGRGAREVRRPKRCRRCPI